jgi:deoxyribodipyrimidine photo-lyase
VSGGSRSATTSESDPAELVVFTRDLRVRDQPALSAAAGRGVVVPAFVFDDGILHSPFNRPNRTGFLLESLVDLDESLRKKGSCLVVRRGDWVDEVLALATESRARTVHVSEDVSGFAKKRIERLESALGAARVELRLHPGIAVVPPGELCSSSGGNFRVFTPYYRRWSRHGLRSLVPEPPRPESRSDLDPGTLPDLGHLVAGERSPVLPAGGEHAARQQFARFRRRLLRSVVDRDDLANGVTSRLGPYLHFGCISPLEVVLRLREVPGSEPFVRQLCWRDFALQLLEARPSISRSDYRSVGRS